MSRVPSPLDVDAARARLTAACTQLGVVADAGAIDKLLGYLEQLQRWNRTYNLTAIRDPQQMLVQHLFDSLAAVGPFASMLAREAAPRARIYDIGAGAGLPGAVLAIMRPDWDVACVDAVEKKMAFVRQVSGVLQLPNLAAIHARVEQLDPAHADIVTSRAFASLLDFATLAGRHVRSGGTLVALKGKVPDDEIEQLHAAGQWQVDRIEPLAVPELDAQRCLIWMRRNAGDSQGNP